MHKRPLYAIITIPLNKPINREREKGEGGWTFFRGRYQREREKTKKGKEFTQETLRNCQQGRRIAFLGTSHYRIFITRTTTNRL